MGKKRVKLKKQKGGSGKKKKKHSFLKGQFALEGGTRGADPWRGKEEKR